MIKNIYNQFGRTLSRHKLVAKYIITGITGASSDLVLLFVFTKYFRLWYLTSAILAFTISFCCAFVAQKYWTFRDYSDNNLHGQFVWYFVTVMSSLTLNLVMLFILVQVTNLHYLFAQIVSLCFTGTLGFVLNVRNVFGHMQTKNGVLIASGIFPPEIGGPATHIQRLSEEFVSRGIKVSVVTYARTKGELASDNFDVIRVPLYMPMLIRGVVYLISLFVISIDYPIIFAQDLTSTGLLAMLIKKIFPQKK